MELLLAALLLWQQPAPPAPAVPWTVETSGTTASLRGLSVVSPKVAWASGTRGTWLRTVDGGLTWQTGQVAGAERLDFRDVKAFSADTAYLLAIAAGGGIYKTTDAGAHWTRQYSDPTPGSGTFFLDCMAFWDADHGLAVGDPSNGTFLVVRTSDGGAHWEAVPHPPAAMEGDGVFAASGTTLVARGKKDAWIATGGTSGVRVLHTGDGGELWTTTSVPLGLAPSAGAGIFSLAFWDDHHGVAVGGDYTRAAATAGNVMLTSDAGRTWQAPPGPPPNGYRSGVAAAPHSHGPVLVAVGTNGVDISDDGGRGWHALGPANADSVAFAPDGSGWIVTGRGQIFKLEPGIH